MLEILPNFVVNLLSLLANIAVNNKSKQIFLYFFLISLFLNFKIFQETFRKLCCGNFPSFRKLSWKLPETAWKFSTLLWTTIKSILHSSPPNEQLSPPISQSLANSLASFFYQKIVSLKDSIASKLQGSPAPFDFDLPHSGEVLSDFTPVTPAEVSQLLR